jgi:1-deoxy-D-xylulose-5-phosphate reductoisomerase
MNLSILGSTGSIGKQALQVAENLGACVKVLACGSKIDEIEMQAEKCHPDLINVRNPEKALQLKRRLKAKGLKAEVASGREGLIEAASFAGASIVLNAIVGIAGLEPTLAALGARKDVALANKETLVAAGGLVMETAAKGNASIIPVDSEHSAIFQCLQGTVQNPPRKILLTSSGGPFRLKTREEAYNASLQDALKHPNWSMGQKITVDSATMMNKGLEVIEAKWLFGLEPEQIEVLVHPQSIIHSMVEFHDGAVIAQLGLPDMRVPIQYALTHPKRMPSPFDKIDFLKCKPLEFFAPDSRNFPCLAYAFKALDMGGLAPAVMNAANEAAVDAFIHGRISFGRIAEIIESVMETYNYSEADLCLDGIFEADMLARAKAEELIS